MIRRLSDDPEEYGLLKSDLLCFAGTPYAHSLLGEVKTVRRWKASTVRSWYQSRLGRQGMTIVVVGDVHPEMLKVRLESILSEMPQGPSPSNRKLVEAKVRTVELRETMDRRQSTVVLGLKAPAFETKNYFALRVLGALLNGMGARLFVELREKHSLAYSVFAAHELLSRSGIFQAYIGCAPHKEKEARMKLLEVFHSLAKEKVSNEELVRAKTYISGLYQVGLQSNRSQMGSLARYEMSGPGAEWVSRYPDLVNKVTARDVQEVAKMLFLTNDRTWVVLGPKLKGDKP
jgi:zinc protease